MKLPSDFGNEIAKALGLSMKAVEELFEFEEDKEGFFYAKLKLKKFLEKPEFKKMCTLVRELGGDSYLEGMKAWRVPGPYAKKSAEKPSDQGIDSERSYKEPRNAIPTDPINSTQKSARAETILISEIKMNERFRKTIGSLSSLVESIKEVGLLHPIVISEKSELIAGWRRIKAFELLGRTEIPCNRVNLADLLKGEMQENIIRKDFTTSERVAIKRFMEPEVKVGQGKRTDLTCADSAQVEKPAERKTRSKVASYAGVSHDTLHKEEAIVKAAEKEPEKFGSLLAKVDSEKISVATAYKKVREAERLAQVNTVLKEKSLVVPESLTLLNDDFTLCTEKVAADSVQLILTDPPYSEEHLDLWENLGVFANRVLVSGGFLVSYCPHFYLPTILNSLSKSLEYFWIIALIVPQHRLIHSRHVFCDWKPLVVFNKPPRILPQFFGDLIKGEGMEKNLHEWQQAEAELAQIIETFCPPNGIILDPMAGSGTTLAAAKRLNRKAIGIEKDLATFEKMKERLAE